ncbi:EcoAI/FtnUII family type I restriction enzme subunit R [Geomonas edaphica]|uniref:EcoAI/FtnUII family type I restriction enzme subunit R n=1 Tax=Geomonas edaphica TaxID=2570226 RepID=UPI0010A8B928|nr:DEAD/DEAH box helicase family protein [Geomonas edaphica]
MKKTLSERDICTQYITPAIIKAGWDLHRQVREEVTFTAGKIIVRGKLHTRGKSKRADYLLYYKPNLPIAVIEAKDNNHTISDGMQQALGYAETLAIPFVFSSNGDAFMFHDRSVTEGVKEREIPLDAFPSPEELWSRYLAWKGIPPEQETVVTQDYYVEPGWKSPRYYQLNAVNKTIEAVALGQNRILLVMATGTGKTFTAFQIIWRLWKSRQKKRILYLADRNILIDQTMTNDFKPFGSVMTKIRNRAVDKSYEVYLALYQGISGTEEFKNIYRSFSPDFFDLVVIDECHRGSAAENSAWREILDYFGNATHIGMTATPKETRFVSNLHYFGEPVYTYSLKQGIEDGFLAPYKVVRLDLDKDAGWRPTAGKTDKNGNEIPDRIYNQRDYDRQMVLEKRTECVAKKVTEYLKKTNRFDKTIVFCEDIDHAERMRVALVNENADLVAKSSKYIMRITGDNEEGKMELDNFINPESVYPVIATTSKLMTTGVDAQTCKLIVLDKSVNSMIEFKQIIGRGTRINEDFDKFWFTIMDFRKATELFADPAFDGEPVQIYEPGPDETPVPPEEPGEAEPREERMGQGPLGPGLGLEPPEPGQPRTKYYVNDVPVFVVNERVQYYGPDGKLITESLKDFTKRSILRDFASLDDFLRTWSTAQKKQVVIEELQEKGIFFDALADEVGKDLDPFDLVCHVAFGQKPLTRQERANSVRKRDYFTRHGEAARAVLEALLDKYADDGIQNMERMDVLKVTPFDRFGSPIEIIKLFGGKDKYAAAVQELENYLYASP